MQYCLTKDQIDSFIEKNWESTDGETDELDFILSQCKYWEHEVVCFSYFLSQVLERKHKDGKDCKQLLDRLFEKSKIMWLTVEQFDEKFINYLFRYLKDREISLEDSLIEIQNKLGEYVYE